MAGRPPKQSIDFAGWSVDIFDNEPKIDKLMDAQGCVGFTIYFFLCQRAYGSNGYFYPWCYDDSATTARKIGGGAGAKSVEETVRYCLHIGLFDKGLFDEWKILTSRGIQKRYMQVAITRTNKSVISEYWLLKKEESAGLIKCSLNSNFQPGNANFAPSKLNYQPLKYSKGKESIEESLSETDSVSDRQEPAIRLTLNDKSEYPVMSDQIATWSSLYPSVDVLQELRKMKGWLDSNPTRRKTKRGILSFITRWLSKEQDKGRYTGSDDMYEYVT